MVTPTKIRAVFVDDDGMVREGIQMLLESDGIDIVATVYRGDDALKVVAQFKPDIAFLEICLPVMNGVEVACRITKQDPAIHISPPGSWFTRHC